MAADTRLYRMTLEEIKDFIAELEPEWKDFARAKEHLHITVYDDRHISAHSPNESHISICPDGRIIMGYEDEEQSNSIRFDKQNKFMFHAGRLIGTVQLGMYIEQEECFDTYQLSNAFAEFWGVSYEDIWIAAAGNSIFDMRFMAYEDASDEIIEIAGSFVREAVRALRNGKKNYRI